MIKTHKKRFCWMDKIPLFSQVKSLGQLAKGNKAGAEITQENFVSGVISLLDPRIIVPTPSKCPAHYCLKKKADLQQKEWMKTLPDSTLITAVTIPGTHDSGCRIGGEFAKCQTWSIGEQLKAGIRFFDIRCRNIKNEFHVVHGIIHCNITFDKVIQYCEDFLIQNPSEFVVMRVKKESRDHYSNKSFEQVYREYAARDVFFKDSKREVTVKEARGKIIVLRDFSGEGLGGEWTYDDQIIQDNYEPPSVSYKFHLVEQHYKNAEPHQNKFHINFLTACTPQHNAWPRYFARHVNKRALEMFKNPDKRSFGGIIVMDFPGEVLIGEVIALNLHSDEAMTL